MKCYKMHCTQQNSVTCITLSNTTPLGAIGKISTNCIFCIVVLCGIADVKDVRLLSVLLPHLCIVLRPLDRIRCHVNHTTNNEYQSCYLDMQGAGGGGHYEPSNAHSFYYH